LTGDSSSVRGCLGNKGVVRLGVIETIRGSCDDDATWGDGCGVILEKGGISHGRGMRSSKEGTVHLVGGNGMFSVCWVTGSDIGKDGGRGMLTGSGVSSIGTGGLYCSIDEYSRRCDPQGTKGSGGDAIQGGSTCGELVLVSAGMNGDGFTRGGDGILGTTGGSGMTSFGRDDDGSSGIMVVGSPISPEGPGPGMNTGDGDLLLIALLRPLRKVRSPSRNV